MQVSTSEAKYEFTVHFYEFCNGNMNSVDWNDGMERWSGLLEWSTGLDYRSATPII